MKAAHTLRMLLSVIVMVTLVNCSKKHHDPQPETPKPPTITDMTPAHGLPGTTVVITGTNFSTTLTNNVVKFNNVEATVTAATATSMTTTVPDAATTGKISIAVKTLSVEGANDFEVLTDIPRTGLVAFYPFSGDAKDATSNHLDGSTLGRMNTESDGPELAADRFGSATHAYSFDGVADYIKVSNAPALTFNGAITYAYWVKLNAVNNYSIMAKQLVYPDACEGFYTELGKDGTDATKSNIFYSFETASEYYSNTNFTGSGAWVFVAITNDGTSTITYVNDAAGVINETPPAYTDCATDLIIGGNAAYDTNVNVRQETLNGSLDDIVIYNRALTATEVMQLYKQTVSKY